MGRVSFREKCQSLFLPRIFHLRLPVSLSLEDPFAGTRCFLPSRVINNWNYKCYKIRDVSGLFSPEIVITDDGSYIYVAMTPIVGSLSEGAPTPREKKGGKKM